ncbi:MAG: RHS repeat domain-containing protein, partial [Saprospiraceae bacterium]
KITKFTSANTGIETTQNYISGIEYNGAALEAVYHEEGRLVPNGTAWHYEYTLKDHLGNSRVMFRANGSTAQLLQENHYYPFGMEMEGAWTAQVGTENKYQYNGKELVEDFGWNWSDYGARGYDASVGRFMTIDRFAEKYYALTPYGYAANNPVLFIDVNGDSIKVVEQHREQFNQILSNVFGEQAANFAYSASGMLTFSGNKKELNKEQRKAFEGLQTVMNEEVVTNVVFGETTEIKLNDGTTETIKASDGGGALSVLVGENDVSENTILVNPAVNNDLNIMAVTPAYYITPIVPANGPRFKQDTAKTNTADKTFHEIGHVLYRGDTQDKVLNYNNSVRKILGLKNRPYDETHNKTVKEKQYGN